MPTHTIHHPLPSPPRDHGGVLFIAGDEARHAMQVKRVRLGDTVRVLDGAGGIADGHIVAEPVDESVPLAKKRERSLAVRVDSFTTAEPVTPRLDVWAATPKGQHVDELVDGLCQIGAASWTPMHAARSIVDPRPTKLERLDRVAVEAMKQCGRAWRLRIESPQGFADALVGDMILPGPPVRIVLADSSGGAYVPSHAPRLRLLVGPEGGWTPAELDAARASGAQVVSFGPHVMRIETAAVVAAGIILAAERAIAR